MRLKNKEKKTKKVICEKANSCYAQDFLTKASFACELKPAMGGLCGKRSAAAPDSGIADHVEPVAGEVSDGEPAPDRLPSAPRYDDEGFCLTPNCRNRRPLTWDATQ